MIDKVQTKEFLKSLVPSLWFLKRGVWPKSIYYIEKNAKVVGVGTDISKAQSILWGVCVCNW
jgi:hypothetical protein